MIDIKHNGEFYECWSTREDAQLIGALRADRDGFYMFHPARRIMLCVKELNQIASKLSMINTEATK